MNVLDKMLARRGASRETVARFSRVGKALRKDGVPACSEWQRIDALERRVWFEDPEELEELVDTLTAELKTPNGTKRLWPIQAVALAEIAVNNGLFGGIRVSGGKTWIAFLAATVLAHCERPILLVPAKSLKSGKVDKAFREARQHWRLRTDIEFISYETLQQREYVDLLEKYRPGLIIADEAHKIGRERDSKESARTNRVQRFIDAHPNVPFVLLSGTFLSSHIVKDIARPCEWALRSGSPLPRTDKAKKDWADALEVGADAMGPRMAPGALARWLEPNEEPDLQNIRRAYGRRYTQTPGVVVSSGDALGQTLSIDVHYNVEHDEVVERAFENLRDEEPKDVDGWIMVDPPVIWSTAQQLELGFSYVPRVRPPEVWRLRRQAWAKYCRERMKQGDHVDSERGVADECRAMGDDAPIWWHEWIEVRDTFKIEVQPIWLSDRRVDQAAAWLKKHKGLCWSQFTAFSERLSQKHGIPYFGRDASDCDGNSIVEYPGGPAIVSIAACSEDLNLQDRWHSNLVIAPPSAGQWWEQLLARTHRFGQEAPEVTCDVWIGCRENFDALCNAREKESAVQLASLDDARKLRVAEWNWDEHIPRVKSRRWIKPSK